MKTEKPDSILETFVFSLLTGSLRISFLILHMQMICEGGAAAFGFTAPSSSCYSSSSSSFPCVEQEWAGEPKHAEKSRAWGLISSAPGFNSFSHKAVGGLAATPSARFLPPPFTPNTRINRSATPYKRSTEVHASQYSVPPTMTSHVVQD
ncbi:hypothetical protein PAMA_016526 [Pampus argenteus]